jgi:CRISPR/Cas system CMR subunit Cmr4 (Cas7 group RAMP superfamily)
MNTLQAGQMFLEAERALEVAKQAKAQAEEILKEALAKNGTETVIVGNEKVMLITANRRSYNLKTLTDMVSSATLKKVTKTEVDSKKFQSAVELGIIKSDVAEAVTKSTPYTQFRVYDLNDNVEQGDATAKVA